LQQLLAAIPGEVVDDVVLAVSEAVTNAFVWGSCNVQLVRVAAGVQGGWIEATICDQAPRPPSLP
jgi:anti-sigma regulatory factor (Ser/Thr protein kinase)